MSTLTAAIELLVGVACVAFAWPSWQRGNVPLQVLGACLALAGAVAIVNAVLTVAQR